jgi:hypothetical protein
MIPSFAKCISTPRFNVYFLLITFGKSKKGNVLTFQSHFSDVDICIWLAHEYKMLVTYTVNKSQIYH